MTPEASIPCILRAFLQLVLRQGLLCLAAIASFGLRSGLRFVRLHDGLVTLVSCLNVPRCHTAKGRLYAARLLASCAIKLRLMREIAC